MKTIQFFAVLLLLIAPFAAQPCADFSADQSRFWLFMPESAEMRDLLPFTYFLDDKYYPNASGIVECTNASFYKKNIEEWEALTGGKVSSAALHQALYEIEPTVYFSKKRPKNAFFTWLDAKGNADFKTYFDFAKKYEALYNAKHEWGEDVPDISADSEQLGTSLIAFSEKTKHPILRLRANYLALKCFKNVGNFEKAKDVFQKTEAQAPKDSWVYGSLCYLYGAMQHDSVETAIWYARATKYNSEAPLEIQRFFAKNANLPFLQNIKNKEEQAYMLGLAALNNPAEQLSVLEKAYALQVDIPILAQLFLREINKIENWLFTERLTGQPISNGSWESQLGNPAFYKEKIIYLHQLRAFVDKVCSENKRKDLGFWHMSRAHLAFLDEDFDLVPQAAELAKKAGLSDLQAYQLELTVFLANYAKNKTLSPEMENQFVALIEQSYTFSKEGEDYWSPASLASRLKLFMAKKLREEGRIAASCLLLGDLSSALALYDAPLYAFGSAKDFDETLRIIQTPNGALETFIQAHPFGYRYDWENTKEIYDHKLEKMVANPNYTEPTWNKGYIINLKSMYLIAQDKKVAALETLKLVPQSFWKSETNAVFGYYFKQNPFSVGAYPVGVERPMPKDSIFTKIEFLEKFLALEVEAEQNPAKKAANYFLLGNAEFNMAYPGYGWFLMNRAGKSSGEVPWWTFSDEEGMAPIPNTQNPWSSMGYGTFSFLSLALGFAFYRKKKSYSLAFFTIFALLPIFFMACKDKNMDKKEATTEAEADIRINPLADFFPKEKTETDKAYYTASRARAYYEKAVNAAPSSEIAVAAYAMTLQCDAAAVAFEKSRKIPVSPTNQVELLKKVGKPTVSQQLMSCSTIKNLNKKMGWTE